MQEDETFLSANDLAKRYNVNRSTPYRWVKDRDFPAPIRLAGVSRWKLSAITAWEEKETNKEVAA